MRLQIGRLPRNVTPDKTLAGDIGFHDSPFIRFMWRGLLPVPEFLNIAAKGLRYWGHDHPNQGKYRE
jgi:hypothetical protein